MAGHRDSRAASQLLSPPTYANSVPWYTMGMRGDVMSRTRAAFNDLVSFAWFFMKRAISWLSTKAPFTTGFTKDSDSFLNVSAMIRMLFRGSLGLVPKVSWMA